MLQHHVLRFIFHSVTSNLSPGISSYRGKLLNQYKPTGNGNYNGNNSTNSVDDGDNNNKDFIRNKISS
jgi:hypothetical protein